MTWAEVDRDDSGTALLLEPDASFVVAKRSVVHGMTRYVRPLVAQAQRLRQAVGVSLLLRAVGLALPLLTAALIDRVLPVNGRGLLAPLALVMTVMVGMNFAAAWLRSRLLLDMRVQVDYRSTLAFLEHLVSLPLTFHQRREAGDLVMRLRSNAIIRETLTSSAVVRRARRRVRRVVPRAVAAAVDPADGRRHRRRRRTTRRRRRQPTRPYSASPARASGWRRGARATPTKCSPACRRSRRRARKGVPFEEFTSRFVDELATAQRKGRLTALLDSANATVAARRPLSAAHFSVLQVLDGHLRLGAARRRTCWPSVSSRR